MYSKWSIEKIDKFPNPEKQKEFLQIMKLNLTNPAIAFFDSFEDELTFPNYRKYRSQIDGGLIRTHFHSVEDLLMISSTEFSDIYKKQIRWMHQFIEVLINNGYKLKDDILLSYRSKYYITKPQQTQRGKYVI